MTDKLRPPRLFLDHKGYYIIDGSKKKRINYGIDNKNVVNVVIENCRTKQKRKRSKANQQKKPPIVKQPSVQEQAMNSRYKLNQLLEQKLLAAQRQEVKNREINLLSKTDNSLSALTKDGVTQASLADQILGTQAPVADRTAPPINDDDYEPPLPQGEAQQLIAEETDTKANQPPHDIEVDQLGDPILPGELERPQIDELYEPIMEEKQPPQTAEQLLQEEIERATKFLNNRDVFHSTALLINLAKKYDFQPGAEGNPDASGKSAKQFLLNNGSFIRDFIQNYVSDKSKKLESAKYQTQSYERVLRELLKKGSGNGPLMAGLYNDQIDDMLKNEPLYSGCCSRDEIHKLNLNDGIGGFVYNTVPSDKPTTYDGHWRAIYIDVDGDKSIDHYDSFGEPAEQDIQEQVKKLLEPYNLPYYLKWKDNKIVNQRSNSSNCGFFCVNFLQDRFDGIPFVDSTGFSNVMKAEKMIKNKFKYLV